MSRSPNGPTRLRRKAPTWPKAAQHAAEVASERAHIGALAAFGGKDGMIRHRASRRASSRWIVDRPAARARRSRPRARDRRRARPSILIAEKRGGTCSIVPVKRGSRARIAPRSGRTSLVAVTRPSASSVSRSSPQQHGEDVGLAAVHHERHGLGRLAERDRQTAGGERIERAGMAGALRR